SDFFLSEFEVIDKNYDISVGNLPEGWNNSIPFSGNFNDITLKENQYFVLGDNRMQSSDSTSWGVLDRERIKGKVLLTYWPLNKFKLY
nr:S26 family signal peptidase [Spirochaetaceae bacterium]